MNEETKKLAGLVAAIAKAMGATVTRAPDAERYWSAKVRTADGVDLWLSKSQDNRLRAAVDLPAIKDRDGNDRQQSVRDVLSYAEQKAAECPVTDITVSMDRAPEAIARDITRRLVPGASLVYAKALERKRTSEEYARGTNATLAKLAKAFKTEPRHGTNLYPGSVTVNVTGPESVSIERVYCSPDTAIAIVRLLQADKSE
jgi:hypothetical protein